MNTIDKSEKFTLEDKEYELKFTNKAVIMAEKELDCKKIITTIAGVANEPMSYGDTYALFKWGLLGAKQYKTEEIDSIFDNFVYENGIDGMQVILIQALTKAGVLSKRKN